MKENIKFHVFANFRVGESSEGIKEANLAKKKAKVDSRSNSVNGDVENYSKFHN